MTTQIADALIEVLGATGVIVVVECEHLCMSMRGVRTPGSRTVTSAVRGQMRRPGDQGRGDEPHRRPDESHRAHGWPGPRDLGWDRERAPPRTAARGPRRGRPHARHGRGQRDARLVQRRRAVVRAGRRDRARPVAARAGCGPGRRGRGVHPARRRAGRAGRGARQGAAGDPRAWPGRVRWSASTRRGPRWRPMRSRPGRAWSTTSPAGSPTRRCSAWWPTPGVVYVAMHWRGPSDVMDALADYDDVVADVRDELAARLDAAVAAGVRAEQVVLDPGLGFAKPGSDNWPLLAHLDALRALGRPGAGRCVAQAVPRAPAGGPGRSRAARGAGRGDGRRHGSRGRGRSMVRPGPRGGRLGGRGASRGGLDRGTNGRLTWLSWTGFG